MKKNYVKEYKGYKVPEGATHWINNNFAKWIDDFNISIICCYPGATWNEYSNGMPKNAIELPEAQQEWNGEGLPPVGVKCVMSYDGSNWAECVINYSSEHTIVCTNESGIELVYSTKDIVMFRPVKTQQEKDREAFVYAALRAYMDCEATVNDYDLELILNKMHSLGFTAPGATDDE